jgi:zinc-binding alcohol dehydrogenase family protein
MMKAYAFTSSQSEPTLIQQTLPSPSGNDLLIQIEAIALNPVDTKVKASMGDSPSEPKIVGWDAVGTVLEIGEAVTLFQVGDKVFYAGDVRRSGCYASHQLVDERIVGIAPKQLSNEAAAAMPLTSLTAWESLFSRLKLQAEMDAGKRIVIIGGAGGVGSIAIQLAKQLLNLTVIATASKTESEQWCRELGADHVINHHGDLVLQYNGLGIAPPDYILCCNDTDKHFNSMAQLIAPQGTICSIVGTQQKHDLDCLKSKSVGFVWEFMFTRPMFQTADLIKQHEILNTISKLLDSGQLKSTLSNVLGPMSAENISLGHNQLKSGNTMGKLVLTQICD